MLLMVSGLGTLAFIGPLLLLGRARLPLMQGPLALVPMTGALVVALVVSWFLCRSARSAGFGDVHLVAQASGGVIAHTVCGDVAFSLSPEDAVARAALAAAAAGLLAPLAGRVRRAGGQRHDGCDLTPTSASCRRRAVPSLAEQPAGLCPEDSRGRHRHSGPAVPPCHRLLHCPARFPGLAC